MDITPSYALSRVSKVGDMGRGHRAGAYRDHRVTIPPPMPSVFHHVANINIVPFRELYKLCVVLMKDKFFTMLQFATSSHGHYNCSTLGMSVVLKSTPGLPTLNESENQF